jgi:hypothetical protein
MARQQLKQYVFTPAGAGVGTVKLPGNFSFASIIAILNTTKQVFIYNFADSTLLGTVTWSSIPDNNFPQSIDGVTTVTLTTDTSSMSANDKLAVYIEVPYPTQRPFATDAVERQRVANPQSLIDADFEYGLQNTKWQSLFTNNDNPSIYEVPGSDVYANTISYMGYLGNAITSGSVASGSSNLVIISNGTSIGNNQPNWTQNDFAIVWNTDPVGKPPTTAYLTANVPSLNQSTLSFSGNVNGAFAAGDVVMLSYFANTTAITTTTANLTAGQTALSISGANTITNGSMIMVQTGNTTAINGYVTEMMTVAAGGGSGALTVIRNRNATNPGNAAILSGYAVIEVGNTEIANIVSITSTTQMIVQRAYYNTIAQDNMPIGTVITKLHSDAAGASGTNVEIVQTTTIGTNRGNIAQIVRGTMGTTPAPQYGAGSPILRLTGLFVAGSVNLPLVGINLVAHGFKPNAAISTTNHTNPNSEGQYQVSFPTYVNYLTYYPRRTSGFPIGYQLNRWDTYIRYAGFYGTASLPPVVLTTDGANPATITATTAYAHGLLPGTPILANIASAGSNGQYATGAFTILSIPSTTTFTYQARSGAAVTGSVIGVIYVRPSAFFTHRAADGGVLIGTGTPHHGASASRQTKKYFRYQSGKGLMWTSGTLLGANYDVVSVSATGTGVGNTITVTTDTEHQLQIGANVLLQGISTSGYNGYYDVQAIIGDYSFQCNATQVLGSATSIQYNAVATTGFGPVGPRLAVAGWSGASVRAGIFDDQNGVFFENTGSTLNVVQRSSTQQTAGYVSVEVSTNLLTGDGTCRFTQDYVAGDKVILRGMTHTVTSIIDDNQMTIAPVWRGLTNQVRLKPVKITERRVPQSQWNIDHLDGTGQSGYLLDATRMQMLMIQYTWYGAGFVDFGVRGPLGNYIFCHRFMNNNLNYEAYMRTGNLPCRYQAINDTPPALLQGNLTAGATAFYISDSTQFPIPTPTRPVYALIDNEIVKCTSFTANATAGGVTPALIGGVTRASTFNLWQDGSNKSFSAGSATSHAANAAVRVISATSAPILNHWGSATILDGGFDVDRGYAYTYSAANIAFPSGVNVSGNPANATVTAFALRLAPAVSNQIPGNLGERDLVNRAQLILQNMVINFSGANISQSTGARYLVEGILNPNNISATSTTWGYLFNSPYQVTTNPSGATQPSYTQIATGNIAGVPQYTGALNFTSYSYASGGASYATGGERLFAIPVNATNSGLLDLSMVKQIGNSGIPGYNIYPDGPELLCINITALVPTPGIQVTGEVQVQWNESQA